MKHNFLRYHSTCLCQVRELVKKIAGLEEQRDALERQLMANPQHDPTHKEGDTPSGASDMPLQDQLLFKVNNYNNVIVA